MLVTHRACAITARPHVPSSLATVFSRAIFSWIEGSASSSSPSKWAMTSVSVSDLFYAFSLDTERKKNGGLREKQANIDYDGAIRDSRSSGRVTVGLSTIRRISDAHRCGDINRNHVQDLLLPSKESPGQARGLEGSNNESISAPVVQCHRLWMMTIARSALHTT